MSELDKLQAVKEQSQAIGEFLDWLSVAKGVVLATWHPHNDELIRFSFTINELLAEYFEIDLAQVDKEQKEILAQLRAKPKDEQYEELARLWEEYMRLGPKRGQEQLDETGQALAFSQYVDLDEDEPQYSLNDILAFFAEKERRTFTALPVDEEMDEKAFDREYRTALREGGYNVCFPDNPQ